MSENISAARAGWKQDEETLLFSEVENGRKNGQPLKRIFDKVARSTGRKPNSIRNYYYARIKQDTSLLANQGCTAFVPFTEQEVHQLLRTVLSEQAKGVSVRACTLALGEGDNKSMLRYQNKYRSLIKNNPALVKSIAEELTREGIPAFTPYALKSRAPRAGRPKKRSLTDVVSDMINQLNEVKSVDVTAFFEAIAALAAEAYNGAQVLRELEQLKANGTPQRENYAELRERIKLQEADLRAQSERFGMLLNLYRQLISVNRNFLGMTGVTKMSSLSNYIRDLSRNVEDCERLMPDIM